MEFSRNLVKEPARLPQFKWVAGAILSLLAIGTVVVFLRGKIWESRYLEQKPPEWRTLTAEDGSVVWRNPLLVDSQNRLWAGGSVLGVTEDGDSWISYSAENSGLAGNGVAPLAEDSLGRIWCRTSKGLSVLKPDGTWQSYPTLAGPGNASGERAVRIKSLAVDQDDRVWIGSYLGLHMLDPLTGDIVRHELPTQSLRPDLDPTTDDIWILTPSIRALAFDQSGALWVGTDEYGVFVLDPDGSWSRISVHARDVWTIVIDRDGLPWIGTEGDGIVRMTPDGIWDTYTIWNSDLSQSQIRSIFPATDGSVWIGTYGGLNVVYPNGTWTVFTTDNSGIAGNRVWSVVEYGPNQMWISTDRGVSVLDLQDGLTTVLPDHFVDSYKDAIEPIERAQHFYERYQNYPWVLATPFLGVFCILGIMWIAWDSVSFRSFGTRKLIGLFLLVLFLASLIVCRFVADILIFAGQYG